MFVFSAFQSLPSFLKGTELISQLFNMTSGDGSSLKSLMKSGKNQDVGRIVGSLSSILNDQAKLTDGEDAALFAEKRKQVMKPTLSWPSLSYNFSSFDC